MLVLYEKLRGWYQVCKRNKVYNRWFTPTRLKDCISFLYEMMTEQWKSNKKLIVTWYYAMDNFSNFDNACLF